MRAVFASVCVRCRRCRFAFVTITLNLIMIVCVRCTALKRCCCYGAVATAAAAAVSAVVVVVTIIVVVGVDGKYLCFNNWVPSPTHGVAT